MMDTARDAAIIGTLLNLLITVLLGGAIPVAKDRTWIRERTIAAAGFTAATAIVAIVLNGARFGLPLDRTFVEWCVVILVAVLVLVPLNWLRTLAGEAWKDRHG